MICCAGRSAMSGRARPFAARAAVTVKLRVLRLHVSMKRPPVIRYWCDRPGEAALVFAELVEAPIQHAEEERIRLGKRRRRQLVRDGKDDLFADAPSGLVFRPPGLDARIPGLRWLHHPGLLEAGTHRARHRRRAHRWASPDPAGASAGQACRVAGRSRRCRRLETLVRPLARRPRAKQGEWHSSCTRR